MQEAPHLPSNQIGKGVWVSIMYLLNTRAPITELSPHALEALGAESTPTAAIVSINGQRAEARLCVQGPSGNHADIPVLGADFMASVRASVQLDYGAGTFSFKAQVCSMIGRLSMHPSSSSHFTAAVQDNVFIQAISSMHTYAQEQEVVVLDHIGAFVNG
jgi:hypothetical protein